MSAFVGIDFGTTNSAIAVAEGAGRRLAVAWGLAVRARDRFGV